MTLQSRANALVARFRKSSEMEQSATLRALTLAAQAVGIVALTYVTHLWLVMLLSLGILIFGHRHSYQTAHGKPNHIARFGAFVALHLAFCWMCSSVAFGGSYPQAVFAMTAMAIVSWDLRSRLNLSSGLGLALINLYVAATLSRDVFFLIFMLAYVSLLLAFLWVADAEDGLKDKPAILRVTESVQAPSGTASTNTLLGLRQWAGRYAASGMLAAALIFVFTPHYAGRPLFRPISIRIPIPSGPSSDIVNPAVPLVQIEGWSDGESEYYYGFDSRLDLSYRGGLSDTVMMYVRSPAWSYWRSHAYDAYDGRTWTQSGKEEFVTLTDNWEYVIKDMPPDGEFFVQSFYVTQPMPNIVYAGGDPLKVYVAADELTIDNSGGMRVGAAFQPGMVYSVLSVRQEYEPEVLRVAGTDYPPDIAARYLSLPDSVSQRTRDLAFEVTNDAPTPYDKTVALRDYLLETFPYDFYPPPHSPGADAVDEFLFDHQRGVCEQYASAHVIMLRMLGIPARLATGYGSGDYNQITGYFEVRANDAHAWTEVYFPEYGWVPFDATPGWNGDPQTGPVKRWIFSGVTDNITLPRLSLPVGDTVGFVGSLLGGLLTPLMIVAGLALAGVIAWSGWRAWRGWLATRLRKLRMHPIRRRIFARYRRAQRQLKARRLPGQTVQEHAAEHPELQDLAEAVDIAAYRALPPDESLLARVLAWRPRRAGER